eukprot:CAMPEP_0179239018 /NCGR_PEP_ID=MMETSP0797-20121207/15248_1 /TAXON_ID=47934 /ORGANISM="Dinophysis acuminata, Strain DAEP01" /LENGTH=99 /DNA_ID=CAMNT_0020946335 /DNA_START=31 /DNA_END=330 /DNA_ORIENTATION=-
MSAEDRFKKAVYLIKNGPAREGSTNETKLNYYKFYKQATEGDVQGSQPWAVQIESRAKWDAWNSVKGMSKEEAMEGYITLLGKDDPNWESHEALKGYSS